MKNFAKILLFVVVGQIILSLIPGTGFWVCLLISIGISLLLNIKSFGRTLS